MISGLHAWSPSWAPAAGPSSLLARPPRWRRLPHICRRRTECAAGAGRAHRQPPPAGWGRAPEEDPLIDRIKEELHPVEVQNSALKLLAASVRARVRRLPACSCGARPSRATCRPTPRPAPLSLTPGYSPLQERMIQWFPGHIAKAERDLKEQLRAVRPAAACMQGRRSTVPPFPFGPGMLAARVLEFVRMGGCLPSDGRWLT